jgi:hypothetical protein
VYVELPRYRGRQFREHAQIGAAPRSSERERENQARLRTRRPPALYVARDRKLIGMLTGGGGGRQGGTAAGFLTKNRQKVSQNVIF